MLVISSPTPKPQRKIVPTFSSAWPLPELAHFQEKLPKHNCRFQSLLWNLLIIQTVSLSFSLSNCQPQLKMSQHYFLTHLLPSVSLTSRSTAGTAAIRRTASVLPQWIATIIGVLPQLFLSFTSTLGTASSLLRLARLPL